MKREKIGMFPPPAPLSCAKYRQNSRGCHDPYSAATGLRGAPGVPASDFLLGFAETIFQCLDRQVRLFFVNQKWRPTTYRAFFRSTADHSILVPNLDSSNSRLR